MRLAKLNRKNNSFIDFAHIYQRSAFNQSIAQATDTSITATGQTARDVSRASKLAPDGHAPCDVTAAEMAPITSPGVRVKKRSSTFASNTERTRQQLYFKYISREAPWHQGLKLFNKYKVTAADILSTYMFILYMYLH